MTLARREPQVVYAIVQPSLQPSRLTRWEQWWRTSEGYVVACRDQHASAPAAAVCSWLGTPTINGWEPLGIHPSDWTAP